MTTELLRKDKRARSNENLRNRKEIVVMLPGSSGPVSYDNSSNETVNRISNLTMSDSGSLKDRLSASMQVDGSSMKDNCSMKDGESSEEDASSSNQSADEINKAKMYKKRGFVLNELIDTERSYIADLSQIVEGYMELIKKNDIEKPPTLIGNESKVFCNVHQIYEWHKNTFQPEMEKCISSPQKLGVVFTRFEKRFYMYVKYCENKPKSEDIVQANWEYFEELREILGHSLQLADMLIKPVQRIMKYQLLLKDILKYTGQAGDDVKDIQKALEVMCIIPRQANDMMNVGRLQGFKGKVTAQGRLLLQDTLEVVEHSSGKTFMDKICFRKKKTFLFEQIIIFSEEPNKKKNPQDGNHYLFCNSIQVNKLLMDPEIPEDPCRFKLIEKTPQKEIEYSCRCSSVTIKKNWVTQIKLLLDMQVDFIAALQKPIDFMNEQIRKNQEETTIEPVSSKKPPTAKTTSKPTRSFKALFAKTSRSNIPAIIIPKELSLDLTSSQCSRKMSLGAFENSVQKTADVHYETTKSKWSLFTSFNRRKYSDTSQLSSPTNEADSVSIASGEVSNRNSIHDSIDNLDRCKENGNIRRNKNRLNTSSPENNEEEWRNSNFIPKTAGIGWNSLKRAFTKRPTILVWSSGKNVDIKITEPTPTPTKVEPPLFVKNLENVSTCEGSSVQLKCQLSPDCNMSSISWIGPYEEAISSGDVATVESDRDILCLKLSSVTMGLAGVYKCQATNEGGSATTQCHVKIMPAIKPKPTKRLTSISNTGFNHEYPQILLQPREIKQHSRSTEVLFKSTNVSTPISWSGCFDLKYTANEEIYRGKFSVFRKCNSKEKKLEVVGKFYSKFLRTKEAVFREAQMSNRCHHSSLIQALELYDMQSNYVIVFPILSYRDKLFDYISNLYTFNELQALTFSCQLFSALSHLNANNIAHLNIKPENLEVDLALTTNPVLKLIDFGDAQQLDPPNNHYIHQFYGDPEFTSPEILQQLPVTCQADVWSASVVMYALLSGTTPFLRYAIEQTCQEIVELRFGFPESFFKNVSPSAVQLISSIFVMPPSQRPPAQICLEKCSQMKTCSKATVIPKASLVTFVERRRNMRF